MTLKKKSIRISPELVIIAFAAIFTVPRIFMFPEFGVPLNLLTFVMQSVFLIALWHLAKWMTGFLDRKLPANTGIVQRILIQTILILIIALPVFSTVIYIFRSAFPHFFVRQAVVIAFFLFVMVIILLNVAFYAQSFFRQWQRTVEENAAMQIKAVELEREKYNIQYHQLRNQVNPHYLFNTLSSLDGLIQTNPPLASDFVQQLSKVYRYVLQHKESEMASVDEELAFIEHYIFLLEVRYQRALRITVSINAADREKGIVMVTLQMLIDNAIKHNVVHLDNPLEVSIKSEEGYITVVNNKQARRQIETSNGQGLLHLRQLYSYLTERPVIVEDDNRRFTVKLPLL